MRKSLAQNSSPCDSELGRIALVRRGILRSEHGRYVPVPAKRDLLTYYANSIRHLLPAAALPTDAADAKEVSASARS